MDSSSCGKGRKVNNEKCQRKMLERKFYDGDVEMTTLKTKFNFLSVEQTVFFQMNVVWVEKVFKKGFLVDHLNIMKIL